MRSISNCYFPVSYRMSVGAGLRIERGRLEPRIGLVSAGEKIFFTVEEWENFWAKKNEIGFYFFGLFAGITFNLPQHEVFFADQGEKLIVLKSNVTWNTIRLSEVEFNKLLHLRKCIDNHIQSIIDTNDFLNYQMEKIIMDLSLTARGKMDELHTQKDAPAFGSRDVMLLLREYSTTDKFTCELITVYEDFFVREIKSMAKRMGGDDPSLIVS